MSTKTQPSIAAAEGSETHVRQWASQRAQEWAERRRAQIEAARSVREERENQQQANPPRVRRDEDLEPNAEDGLSSKPAYVANVNPVGHIPGCKCVTCHLRIRQQRLGEVAALASGTVPKPTSSTASAPTKADGGPSSRPRIAGRVSTTEAPVKQSAPETTQPSNGPATVPAPKRSHSTPSKPAEPPAPKVIDPDDRPIKPKRSPPKKEDLFRDFDDSPEPPLLDNMPPINRANSRLSGGSAGGRPEWNNEFTEDSRDGFDAAYRRQQREMMRAKRASLGGGGANGSEPSHPQLYRDSATVPSKRSSPPPIKKKPVAVAPSSRPILRSQSTNMVYGANRTESAAALHRHDSAPPVSKPPKETGVAVANEYKDTGPSTRINFDKRTSRFQHRDAFMRAIQLTRFPSRVPQARMHSNTALRTYIRKRPLFDYEASRGEFDVVLVDEQKSQTIVHNCLMHADLHRMHMMNLAFPSTQSFGERTDSAAVYAHTLAPLICSVAAGQGAIATCLMYGQTGSGKSFTMNALQEYGARDLFARLQPYHRDVRVSIFEVAGKACRDLLSSNGQAEVTFIDGGSGELQLCGAVERVVTNPHDFLAVVEQAKRFRKTQSTAVNSTSSRSHCLTFLTLPNSGGRLVLVDCAGSERKEDSAKHTADRRKEGAEINASIHALKECMRAMANGAAHIPFRASLFTKVLKESFTSPRSQIAIIATVSPTATDTEHTIATLRTTCEWVGVEGQILDEKENLGEDKLRRMNGSSSGGGVYHPPSFEPFNPADYCADDYAENGKGSKVDEATRVAARSKQWMGRRKALKERSKNVTTTTNGSSNHQPPQSQLQSSSAMSPRRSSGTHVPLRADPTSEYYQYHSSPPQQQQQAHIYLQPQMQTQPPPQQQILHQSMQQMVAMYGQILHQPTPAATVLHPQVQLLPPQQQQQHHHSHGMLHPHRSPRTESAIPATSPRPHPPISRGHSLGGGAVMRSSSSKPISNSPRVSRGGRAEEPAGASGRKVYRSNSGGHYSYAPYEDGGNHAGGGMLPMGCAGAGAPIMSYAAADGSRHPNAWSCDEASKWVQSRCKLVLPSGVDGKALMRWSLAKCVSFCENDQKRGLRLFNGLRLEIDSLKDDESKRRKQVMMNRR